MSSPSNQHSRITRLTRPLALALALAACAAAALCPTAQANLLPPAGPWPTPVAGASNPLAGTAYALNGANATSDAVLRAWFVLGHRHTTLSRPAGFTSLLEGSLRGYPAGRPIEGAELTVVIQDAANPTWQPIAFTRTDTHGYFRYRLPAGSSRRVAVLYWPAINAPAPVYSARLLNRTTTRVWLGAHTKGRSVTFVGKISDGPTPSPALIVAIQVRNELGAWVTAVLTHASAAGRFRTRYRFEPGVYAVRALVPEQTAWPYFAGTSNLRRIRPR
jgi:hypothetical protein